VLEHGEASTQFFIFELRVERNSAYWYLRVIIFFKDFKVRLSEIKPIDGDFRVLFLIFFKFFFCFLAESGAFQLVLTPFWFVLFHASFRIYIAKCSYDFVAKRTSLQFYRLNYFSFVCCFCFSIQSLQTSETGSRAMFTSHPSLIQVVFLEMKFLKRMSVGRRGLILK